MNVREIENFLYVVLDGHIEAALLAYSGIDSTKDFKKLIARNIAPLDFETIIDRIANDLYDFTKIQEFCYDDEGKEIRYQAVKGVRKSYRD